MKPVCPSCGSTWTECICNDCSTEFQYKETTPCKLKYLCINGSIPILFPICFAHKDVLEGVKYHVCSLSAGYCMIGDGLKVECWGGSKDINVDSNPSQDEYAIESMFK